MSFNSRSQRIVSIICVALSAMVLVGCDEKYVNSRQEAESYAKSHPNVPDSKIFVQDDNGKEIPLEDLRVQERVDKQAQTPEPTTPVVPSTSKDQAGEVLKYEDVETGTPIELFSIGNIMGVYNGGTPPAFTFNKQARITELMTYHWNDAKGKVPGTIGLKDVNGKIYGPWKATSSDGQGGAQNVYWKTTLNINLPAGSYAVIDSDPATWSQNTETKGVGMTWIKGWWK